jgi:hypothetical protein
MRNFLKVMTVAAIMLCAIFIYWHMTRISLAALPYLQAETYHEREAYRVDPYISAAQRLQAMGQVAACNKLLALSHSDDPDDDDGEKVVVLCRMLFTNRLGSDFRHAWIGRPIFLDATGYSDWPLEPIEIVDGIPFSICTGYAIFATPEPPEDYVRYCMTNCDWSSIRFEPKTKKQKQEALAKLLASPKWHTTIGKSPPDYLAAQTR